MATKKMETIPGNESINEQPLPQTESAYEEAAVLMPEKPEHDAAHQTDSEFADQSGIPIEDAAHDAPEDAPSQTDSEQVDSEEFPAGSDIIAAPEAPVSQTDSEPEEKKPEESPPARRTRKPRAKKSESDTATGKPPGNASDGVDASEKKTRKRASAKPALPIISIDDRPSVETEADKARNDLLDLMESMKTKRILTDTIQGIERLAEGHGPSLAVIYHGDIKVIIPAD